MTKRKQTKVTPKPVTLADIFNEATGKATADRAKAVLSKLEPDQYTDVIIGNLDNGIPDIRSLLYYLAHRFQPTRYLEIGVRRGYSMAMVCSAHPNVNVTGVDMWVANYGGVAQIGAMAVEKLMKETIGHKGDLQLLNGNSHVILPQWFSELGPDKTFDLILVDADHTYNGALTDLRNVLPRLAKGGYLVFDDLHDAELERAWVAIRDEQPDYEYCRSGIVGLIRRV